jgi:hypothetical protein
MLSKTLAQQSIAIIFLSFSCIIHTADQEDLFPNEQFDSFPGNKEEQTEHHDISLVSCGVKLNWKFDEAAGLWYYPDNEPEAPIIPKESTEPKDPAKPQQPHSSTEPYYPPKTKPAADRTAKEKLRRSYGTEPFYGDEY